MSVTAPYLPAPIHEWRNPSPWTTCAIDSATMGAAKATMGGIPSTGSEADRLWSAIGRGAAGYTSRQVRDGQQKLYAHQPAHYRGRWSTLREHLTSTNVVQGCVVYGSYPRLPAAIRDTSRQPGYQGLHGIYCQNVPGTELVDVLDPLGKAGAVRVHVDQLQGYAGHPDTSYEHDLYREAEWAEFLPPEEEMNYLKGADPIVNRRVAIGAGATVRTSPAFNPKNYNENKLFGVGDGSSAPALAWVSGTNLTLSDGRVYDARTRWLAIQGKDYGIGFIHERDVVRLDPIEKTDCSGDIAQAEQETAAKVNQTWRSWLTTAPK